MTFVLHFIKIIDFDELYCYNHLEKVYSTKLT